jgi:serine/threonine protein kinase
MSRQKIKPYYFIPTSVTVTERNSGSDTPLNLNLDTIDKLDITPNNFDAVLVYKDRHSRLFRCTLSSVTGSTTRKNVKRFSRVYNKEKMKMELVFEDNAESHGVQIKKSVHLLPSHVDMDDDILKLAKYERTCQDGGLGWYTSKRGKEHNVVMKSNSSEEGLSWKQLCSSVKNPGILPLNFMFRATGGKCTESKVSKTSKWYVMGMPQCDMDLWDYITSGIYKPKLETSMNMASKVASALAAISRSPFKTHGDVKPENIFVKFDEAGKPALWLADFDTCEKGGSKTNLGTKEYFAPDRSQTGCISEKDDVYAFALVFLSMLTASVYPSNRHILMSEEGRQLEYKKDATRVCNDEKFVRFVMSMLNPNSHERMGWDGVISNIHKFRKHPPTHQQTARVSNKIATARQVSRKPTARRPTVATVQGRGENGNSVRKRTMYSVVIE